MNNKKGFTFNQILLLGLAFIWIIAFVIGHAYSELYKTYWIVFGFGFAGMIVAELCCYFSSSPSKDTEEVAFIPGYYTIVYVLLLVITNIICLVILAPVLIIAVINLLLMLGYVFLTLHANKYLQKTVQILDEVSLKHERYAQIKQELNIIISITDNTEHRKQLLALKELVDMSNSIVSQQAATVESDFLQRLHQIKNSQINGVSSEETTELIKDAIKLWNIRNS